MHGAFVESLIHCLTPFDYEEVDVGNVVIGLSSSKLIGCQAVEIRFTGGDLNFRVDGGAPTASVGIPAYDGDTQKMSAKEAVNLKMIRTGVTNGKARTTFYK